MTGEKIIANVVQVGDQMIATHDRMYTGGRITTPKNALQTTPPVPVQADKGVKWAWWGDSDDLPTSMRNKVELVPIAGAVVQKKIQFMMGEDLVWYKTDELRKYGKDAEQVFLPEVEDFMQENRIENEWWPAQCADFCLPYNCFSEMILNKGRNRISNIYHIAAEHARLSKANKAGQVDFLQYSKYFPFKTAQSDESRVYMPLYKWYDHQRFFDGLLGYKFGWHTRYTTPGMIYYARPWWIGLFKEDGWMDVSASVPKIVSAMQKNQISLKYIIAIPEEYFIVRHPDWMTYSAVQRQEVIDGKIDDINAYLAGSENVMKSISYVFREDPLNHQAIGKIEITAVDDKAKTGTWVPDSYAADAQIVQGFGMDPSQIGLAPEGGKMGAGSGSDKMQSFNQLTLLNTPDQRLALEPLNFISRFNNWGVTCMVKHTNLTTQDQNRNGVQTPPATV